MRILTITGLVCCILFSSYSCNPVDNGMKLSDCRIIPFQDKEASSLRPENECEPAAGETAAPELVTTALLSFLLE